MKTGSESKISHAAVDQSLGLLGRLDVLDDPAVGACVVEFLRVLDHALERAPGRAHALDGGDFVLEREDRLDLQRTSEPGLGFADASAAAQVLERVQTEPDAQRLARLAHARGDGRFVGTRAGGRGPGEREQANPTAGGFPVDHLDALAKAALGE